MERDFTSILFTSILTNKRKIQALIATLILISSAAGGLWPATAQETEPVRIAQTQTASKGGVPGPGSPGAFEAGAVLVKFKEGASVSAMESTLDRANAVRIRYLHNSNVELWQVLEGHEMEIVERLTANPIVEYAELNYVYHTFGDPDDPRFSEQWAHTRMQSSAAWDITTGSTDVTIAIIDTGIDEGHPDLVSKIAAGYDFVDRDSDPHDLNGHGTHCAGIAAALANNGTGIAGTDWNARIMPIRVLDREGSGYSSDITDGITWAYQHGAQVLSLSLGGAGYSQAMQDAISAAHAAGSLVVAAMGNCRTYDPPACPSANPTNYPAAYSNVMAVAATGRTDGYTYYSQYGNHCDIAAPGGEISYLGDPDGILSTLPTYDSFYLRTAYGYRKDYDHLQGTSMATPYVAGLAGLVWAADPTMTPDQVQDTIQSTADDLGSPGWDQDFGHGRINGLAALQDISIVTEAPALSPIDNSSHEDEYQITWSAVSQATGYTLQEADDVSFSSPITRYVGTALQYNVTGQQGGAWYYRVHAYNAIGAGPWSTPPRSTTVTSPALQAPSLSAINNGDGDGEYLVDWTNVFGATSYTLEESRDPYFSAPSVYYTGTASQVTVVDHLAGTWYYRARAFGLTGKSPWSDQQSALTTAYIYLPLIAKEYGPGMFGLPIDEGFEGGVVPPSGWTRVQTNSRQTWGIETQAPYAGSYRASCEYDSQLESQDEVLLSPEFQAWTGQLQFHSFGSLFWCRDIFDNCDLNVWLVIDEWGGGDDILVYTADDDWTATGRWASSTVNLTPYLPTDTPVRIGFQYEGLDGAQVGLDAISITGQ